MYRQMSKWHQNVTEELHKIVQTSEHTENGLTGVNSDIKSIMQQLQHMEDTAAAAAAAAAVSSSSGKTPPSVDDVLDPVWDDYDPKNYQDYEVDGDVDSIFEKFVDKVRFRVWGTDGRTVDDYVNNKLRITTTLTFNKDADHRAFDKVPPVMNVTNSIERLV